MNDTRRYLFVPASGVPTAFDVYAEEDELAVLQDRVHGWIEAVTLDDGHTIYLNEEGKLEGLPLNVIATKLARDVLQPDDFIVGDCVVTGPLDEYGENTNADPAILRVPVVLIPPSPN